MPGTSKDDETPGSIPLSRWAKMAMTVQATVSIVTVALVVARAVNTLR